jgi:hypothetical protein
MNLENKRIEWKARFDAWKSSELSVAEWCREQGLKDHQMYYWIQKFEQESLEDGAPSNTQWLTVNVKNEPSKQVGQEPVFIHFDSISVEVRPGADMVLLSDVVHVLKSP